MRLPSSDLLMTQVRQAVPTASMLVSVMCWKLNFEDREDLLVDFVGLCITVGPRMSTINNDPSTNETARKPSGTTVKEFPYSHANNPLTNF